MRRFIAALRVPLVLAADQPGKEILHPVAVVIVGGLVSSTLLDMAVTPAVFWTFGPNDGRVIAKVAPRSNFSSFRTAR